MPLMTWATHVLQWTEQREAKPRGWSETQKTVLSSDCSLQLDCTKLGIASNRESACRGEYVLGPCTHRPSHHESRVTPEAGGLTARKELSKVGLMIGVKS